MVFFTLQAICALLFATGILFTLVDLRTRYDRGIRYFGLSLIFLSMIAGIDLWVMPSAKSLDERLYWQRILHILACGFIPFSYSYICTITKANRSQVVRLLVFSSVVFSGLFFNSGMLRAVDGKIAGGLLYYLLFFPYVLVYVGAASYLILSRFRKSQFEERRILGFHIIGFSILCLTGIMDMAGVASPALQNFPSYKTLGILAFGIMATMIFTERFLQLLMDRDATFSKLETAYRDLEQVNVLKQLGESTAIINHEIKNYMFMISGNAQLLDQVEHLSLKGQEIVRNIVSSVERLTEFSDDILKLSRTQLVKELHPINLSELVKGLVDKHYFDRKARFNMIGVENDQFIHGDWGKLEHVFLNAFNNSFEAGDGKPVDIRVKFTAERGLLLVSIEDNGAGCNKEQLDGLFKAFYTTKKSQGGTGLGMSIARTIVESHGGKISAYSKNLAKQGERGLKLILTFPVFAQNLAEDSESKGPIVVVKDGMENLSDIIRIFQNVKVVPHLVSDASELNEADFPPDSITVLVSAKAMAQKFPSLSNYPMLCLVSQHDRNLYILDHGRSNRLEIFSEEYVVTRLLRPYAQRQRLRERQFHMA